MHSTFQNRISTAETSVGGTLLDHGKYKVSVMDMVNSSRKNATEEPQSMPGFPLKMNPNFDANLDKV